MTKHPLTKALFGLALIAWVIIGTFYLLTGQADSQTTTTLPGCTSDLVADWQPGDAPVCCAEDDPCWDCATMGNRLCGPVTTTTVVTYPIPSTNYPVTATPSYTG